jgi:hypothetical protein
MMTQRPPSCCAAGTRETAARAGLHGGLRGVMAYCGNRAR